MYCFEEKIASRGYHVYRNTTWTNAYAGQRVAVFIETNKNSIEKDPYACAIKKQNANFGLWDTVGHIPREISRHVYYFIAAEGGSISGTVMSTDYRHSPIPSGGLEIPLKLQFSANSKEVYQKMKWFVEKLYNYEFTGIATEEDVEDEEEEVSITIHVESEEEDDDIDLCID